MTRPLPPLEEREIDAVIIGGSAGGLEAMLRILSFVPANYRLPLIALLHRPVDGESRLAEIFGARLAIPVEEAVDKTRTRISVSDDVGETKGARARYTRSVSGWKKILSGLADVVRDPAL